MKHWSLDDVAWGDFDPARVDPDIVPLVKAAAMVERNGMDYAVYLGRVFVDDPDFRQATDNWAVEEVQHGDALGRWAGLADPGWDFAAAFERYRNGYKLPLDVDFERARLPDRRADRPLHGGDRDEQLLHGARGCDRGASAQAGVQADRRRRIPAFQAVLRPYAPVLWPARS